VLVAAVERWARESRRVRIALETDAANHRVRRFYNELGYTDQGVVLTRALN
jgi:GNAT superfamily N-acetyltransferase